MRLRVLEPELGAGDVAELEITTERAGYAALNGVDSDGRTVNVLFPNALDGKNQFEAGRHRLPRPGWRLATTGPAGIGSLYLLFCTRPVDAEAVRASVATCTAPPKAVASECGASVAVYREIRAS